MFVSFVLLHAYVKAGIIWKESEVARDAQNAN